MFARLAKLLSSATFLRRLHGWSAVGWFVAAFPVMFWLSQSVGFLVFISVYAIVVGHWEAWQASRIEEKQGDT